MKWWTDVPKPIKALAGVLAAVVAIATAIGTIFGNLASVVGTPAWNPGYDQSVEARLAKTRAELKVDVDKATRQALKNEIATLNLHVSLTNGQLTAVKRDPGFAKSWALQTQAAEYEGRLKTLADEHARAEEKLRNAQGD